ncbi:DNA sulfur modification protein DndD [Lederbergia citrea]|uniref:DNA sulfur modification protein DndD n=1 Tax=Lederbergia citrea TaxID=2833581 RepID=UPI001BC8FA26|nr:DNA sulfur modification protein DndD [Lederbergia citrea]MBS4205477.1 DNA sulfur modification protein DndD [Lederbergia citrea]
MILKKLVFDSYKTYYGQQEIDLYIPKEIREEKGQNIILLGGLNGAGKTTILKAIIYILFGKRGMSETEYKRLFSNVINNTFFDEGGRECSVSLILETDSGEEWNLKIKWYFDKSKRMTQEERELSIKKPGTRIPKHARIENIEVFNKFIDRIIPYHAAPFFIFDGEEIRDVILRQNSQEMKDAIHKISGMEAYKQLLLDLNSLKDSLENKLAKSVSQKAIDSARTQLEKAKEVIIDLEKKDEHYQSHIRNYEKLIYDAKLDRNNKITKNSKSREVFIKEQTKLATQLEITKKNYNDFLNNNLLILILKDKVLNLKEQLRLESDLNHKRIVRDASLTPYRNFINQLLNKNITPPLTQEQLEQITKLGEEIWVEENKIKNEIPTSIREIHDISKNDYNYLINLPLKDKIQLSTFVNDIERLTQKMDELEKEIRNAPEAINVDKEDEKIDLLVKKLSEYQLRKKVVSKKLRAAYEEKSTLMNNITRMAGLDENVEALQQQNKDVSRTIKAMEQYVKELTDMKANFIKEEFAKMLQRLFRKQDEFGKIEFDINTYTIRLYNDRMQEISIHDRSAGELQMISSALIWALTKASDLSLPMVIDTPLGRLDSYHRNHLINYYYKELSDQVIILSTDTEITEEYIKLMKNHSYKQYMLDYNESKKYTIVRDGYFNFIKR